MQVEEQIDNRQGKSQIISNIKVLSNVATYLRSTLGPYGLDKLIIKENKMTITNDGATIMKQLGLKHPAAKLLENACTAQDEIAGDGTTSIVLLCVELLICLEELIKTNEIKDLTDTLEEILGFVICELDKNSFIVDTDFNDQYISPTLKTLAKTSLTSKVVKYERDLFADIVVEGCKITNDLSIKSIPGDSLKESMLFQGVAFKKCFTYAGYEQQPKKIQNAKILMTNVELEWKAERENAEIRIEDVSTYQNVVDAEWQLITDKLKFAIEAKADVVLSTAPIGDYATQYFAKHGIFCSGRVYNSDIEQVRKYTGGRILSTMNLKSLPENKSFLGFCDHFEEKQVGDDRYNFFGVKNGATIILRGPGEEMLEEMERSLNDAIMVVKKNMKPNSRVVTGGGTCEMYFNRVLSEEGLKIGSKKMFVYLAVAKAFENMVNTLINNFGMDTLSVLGKLQAKIKIGEKHYGLVNTPSCIADMRAEGVYEPLDVKRNVIIGAFTVAKNILKIDSTIIVPERN